MAVKQTTKRANRRIARTSFAGYVDGGITVPLFCDLGGPDRGRRARRLPESERRLGWRIMRIAGVAGGPGVQKGEKCSRLDSPTDPCRGWIRCAGDTAAIRQGQRFRSQN